MIEGSNEEDFSDIVLIDYGYAKKYLDENKKHKKQEDVKYFRGNFMFASKYQLDFKSTSRRDDLISLCYIMIYLANNQEMPLFDIDGLQSVPDVKHMDFIRDFKKQFSLAELTKAIKFSKLRHNKKLFAEFENAFIKFVSYIETLAFD